MYFWSTDELLVVEEYQNQGVTQGINSAFLQLSLFNLNFVIMEEALVKVLCSHYLQCEVDLNWVWSSVTIQFNLPPAAWLLLWICEIKCNIFSYTLTVNILVFLSIFYQVKWAVFTLKQSLSSNISLTIYQTHYWVSMKLYLVTPKRNTRVKDEINI